ncbi:AAA family ATPase [Streptomyces sp. ME02-8801-2C]|uniref:AAA family ATPase n=1 Tax=Streptomyces sp. ME02-8801-2C TaxID=3028680 RepID=UPI0029A64ABB|nr:AAA family ATPase [Streptomyces sp. ME02-8801-2C]MDX3456717.1 AAA family ATPase [Streptomyces sp. ME02-8801-2C]
MTTATDTIGTPEPDWYIYRGAGRPHDGIGRLPTPPPWRDFDGVPGDTVVPPLGTESTRRLGSRGGRGIAWRPEQLELINAALYLRRPLLVTGDPGSGKSTLAHAIAHELGLGRVLQWPIVSRTTLREGLYRYDAIARLQDTQMAHARGETQTEDIGDYLRLGPLGTALLPYERPRVLLVDELDKSDIDLPNDLLNALEEGEFRIAELQRIAKRQADVEVLTDDDERAAVKGGRVRCKAFPIVVMTSNGERDFPAPLLRRCLHLDVPSPHNDVLGRARLDTMVTAHFGEEGSEVAGRNGELIRTFLDSAPGSLRAADQLLNAIYLTQEAVRDSEPDRKRLAELLMRPLDHGEHGPGGGPR